MATDATGTPTPLGIPKYNVDVDSPTGRGGNAQMDAIDALIQGRVLTPGGLTAANGLLYNGATWVNSKFSNLSFSAGASLSYSKLVLTGSVLNADLAGSINPNKLTSGDAESVIVTRGGTNSWVADRHNPYNYTPIAGDWIPCTGAWTNAASAQTINKLFFVPVWIPASGTYDAITFQVGIAGASGNVARVGIYDSASNRLPVNLVAEFGTVSTTSTGIKTIVSSASLTGNQIYYVAWVSQVGTGSKTVLQSLNTSWPICPQIQNPIIAPFFAQPVISFAQTGVSGSLPSTAGALSAVTDATGDSPYVAIRKG